MQVRPQGVICENEIEGTSDPINIDIDPTESCSLAERDMPDTPWANIEGTLNWSYTKPS